MGLGASPVNVKTPGFDRETLQLVARDGSNLGIGGNINGERKVGDGTVPYVIDPAEQVQGATCLEAFRQVSYRAMRH